MTRGTEGERPGFRGRIAAGDVLLRFGSPHGARAEWLGAEDRPTPKPRPAAPPAGPFPEVIDRVEAIERAGTAVVAARPVLLHGRSGIGKTTLLRHLSRTAANDAPDGAGAWPDGTILVSARDTSAGDLLQILYRALHASDTPLHATPLQIENGLRERQALVLVDDLDGSAEEVRTILSAASASAFAVASREDLDEIDVVRVGLGGLPADAGVELVARAIDQEPTPLEAARIREIHRAMDGSPLLLLQTAALLHEGTMDLDAASAVASEEDPVGALADRLDESLSDAHRRALLALEAVRPVSLAASDAAAIADLDDPGMVLEGLAHRGLARVEGARYRGAGGLAAGVAERHDPDEWRRRALDHFAASAVEPTDAARSEPGTESLRWALDHAMEASRWADAVAISRAMETDLALRGLWEAWGDVLERGLEASRGLDDAATEAWFLHQRGTRALALGETGRATHDLERAIELREGVGDEAAAGTSRENLALLREETPAPVPAGGRGGGRSSELVWVLLTVGLVILAALGLLLLRDRGGDTAPVDAGSVRFEERPVGMEALAPVVVSNTSSGPVDVGTVGIAGADEEDFSVVQDACSGAALERDERCSIILSFRPAGTGERAARLVVPFRDDRPREISLSGRGALESEAGVPEAGDPLRIAPTRLEFADQPVGTSSGALPIALVNRGAESERIAVRLESPGTRDFAVDSDNCSNEVLPPGGSCLVEVRFRPAGPGQRSARLVVRDLGRDETRRVALSGTGTAAGDAGTEAGSETAAEAGGETPFPAIGSEEVGGTPLVPAPRAIDFGEVPAGTRGETRTATIENRGSDPLQVASTRLAGLDAAVFAIVEDRCVGRLLPVGATCTIDVAFEPSEAGGWSARLVVLDPTGDRVEIGLDGTGE